MSEIGGQILKDCPYTACDGKQLQAENEKMKRFICTDCPAGEHGECQTWLENEYGGAIICPIDEALKGE